ncbi:MAG: hypothetical protein JOZ90_06540 [Alphaproteobacteria bacterium]|nr:hypothetical protein [Alphaproteobacteria bacterium]MBV9370065.1 hypothetical protein [Alphaproteobacteria bacterium]MBV9900739.1 hypothetical protein [Alphaproteobacteria bacterium]
MDRVRERELAAMRDRTYGPSSSPGPPISHQGAAASGGGDVIAFALAAASLAILLLGGGGQSASMRRAARDAREAALQSRAEARWGPRLLKALDGFSRLRDLEAVVSVRALSPCHRQAFDALLRGSTTGATCFGEGPESYTLRAYPSFDHLDVTYYTVDPTIRNEIYVMAVTRNALRATPRGEPDPVAIASLVLGPGTVRSGAKRNCIAIVAHRYASNDAFREDRGSFRREKAWVHRKRSDVSLACPDGRGFELVRSRPFTLAEDPAE